MSDHAEVESFRITLSLGATVEVNGQAWVKPSASSSISWSGVPDADQVHAALQFMEEQILSPTLDEVMNTVVENTKRAKGISDSNPYSKG